MKRILIVGGGICGLAMAARLVESRAAEVTLVESDNRLGGKILTIRDNTFTLEAGPDSFLTVKPAAYKLCESLGLEDHLVDTRPENNCTYVVRRRKLHVLPGGMASFVPTEWGPFIRTGLLSTRAKLRMALEPFVPASNGRDPSIADFFSRRLGAETYQWLVEPLLAGIYAGRGASLGLRSTFPRFLDLERKHGSLFRASLSARMAPRPSRGMFQTLRYGLGEMIDALQAIVQPRAQVRLGVTAQAISLDEATGRVRVALSDGEWKGDNVALCIPTWAAAPLVAPLDTVLARLLVGVRYSSTATVSMAFHTDEVKHPLNGYGFVVPRAEGRSTLASTWTSQKWPHRAPPEWRLLRAYLGGLEREAVLELDDDLLVEEALGDLRAILGTRLTPRRVWVHRWERALPQYVPGHADHVASIEARAAVLNGRVVLAGSAYHGVGIPDCIADGHRVADEFLKS